ncbi:hypothetical protein ON010_g4387 [Phytophthora cinnamomi]|nr:hypothetical protein ON010_g4387 [Phytophthora cinnamomi]
MADDDRKPKRQKLVDAAAEAANAAASAATDACDARQEPERPAGGGILPLPADQLHVRPAVAVRRVSEAERRAGAAGARRERSTRMLVALYPEKVRVAIFTANFLSNDWDTKTQGVWFQDFGLKVLENSDDEETEAVANSARVNGFEADLVHYLSSLGAPVKLFCGELKRFDFSTAHVALVPSVPGVHKGKGTSFEMHVQLGTVPLIVAVLSVDQWCCCEPDMEKYGHLRVRKLLKMYQVPPTDNPLICQFSSLGSLDEKWLFGEFAESFLPGKKNISPTSMPVQALHIIWPSVEDVRNSLEGWNSGRSIPCPLKNMKPFLHKYLRKWTPPTELHRQNAMPHIKSYARFNPSDEAAGELDWALVTSSNLSKAAWGALQKNKSQFMIRSYELGVMFLPQLLGPADDNCPPARLVTLGSKAAERSGVEVSESQPTELLPLPYGFPLTTYNPKQDEPVVLPTDELVRVECRASTTVADLLVMLEKRRSIRKSNGVERNGDEDHVPCDNNNCGADPTTEQSLAWRSKRPKSSLFPGKLTLVRHYTELKAEMLVVDEVKDLDILEFQHIGPGSSEWIPESNFKQSRARISPIIRSPSPRTVKEVRPLSSIPLWQVKQDRAGQRIPAPCQTCSAAVEHLASLALTRHPEARLRKSIQNSTVRQSAFRRRGARKRPSSRSKRRCLLFTSFQERRRAAKVRKYAERILLQAGMQMIERIQLLQQEVRKLVFILRDAILGGSVLTANDLLTLARTMVIALTHTGVGSRPDTFPASDDTKENTVRKLSWNITGKDGGVSIVVEGWVVTAEWGTFWRTQRKEYACLCDNHMLYFFASRIHCADFVFEMGREREGSVSEASKRLLKDNSPLSQIDLSETDWSVRKSSILGEGSDQPHRNAFAFFDSKGRMQLVLDVNTAAEATLWARLISAEISRNNLFSRIREFNGISVKAEDEEHSQHLNPLATWMEIMTQTSASFGEQHSLIIPLRSLYSQIDRLNGTARAERYKSWTLSQALKDLQRDRVKINRLLLAGASLEANILALTLEILRCTETDEENTGGKSKPGEAITSASASAREMTALRFARQVIICSSRTHGGGDILDTLHLLFGHERFCICPDAQSMEPIEISISKPVNTGSTPSAQITMKMVYRVIPTDSIGPMDDRIYTNGNDATNTSVAKAKCSSGDVVQGGRPEHLEAREFKILGTYTQTLKCHFTGANDMEGCVQLQFAGF